MIQPGDFSFHFLTTAFGVAIGVTIMYLLGASTREMLICGAIAFPIALYLNF